MVSHQSDATIAHCSHAHYKVQQHVRGPEPALGQTPPDESKIFTKISTNIVGSVSS